MNEKRNIGSGDRHGGIKKETIRTGNNGQNRITYNRQELLNEQREIERIRRIENYTPVIPTPPSGAGDVYGCIQTIVRDVMDIYNQVDLLINATVKALNAIDVEIQLADEKAANQYK